MVGGEVPWHEVVDFAGGMIGDAVEDGCEPRLRVDAIQFGGFDECVGDGSGFSAVLRPHEEVVFSAKRDGAHGAFGAVVVDLQPPVVEVRSELWDA